MAATSYNNPQYPLQQAVGFQIKVVSAADSPQDHFHLWQEKAPPPATLRCPILLTEAVGSGRGNLTLLPVRYGAE